ncbi:MAG TPA: beta-ketoacyl-ACP synthase II [Aggregatilineales bacterium]|jgi:beta-ketoacyl-acyl-carrier-protein synthase II|nr:beta-ketoacyl-ACP synthase II [Aggregatilineales bacterium]
MKRVVVTGFGAISPLGHDVETTWDAIKNGRSGVGPITLFDASRHGVQIAAEVKNFVPEQYVPPKEVRRRDRYQHLIAAAVKMAVEHSGLVLNTDEERERTGVIVGSSVGGTTNAYFDQVSTYVTSNDPRKITPFGIPMMMVNGGSGLASIEIGALGPSCTLASACATGADCIGTAFEWIAMGKIDRALAGAGDAPISPIGIAAFDRIGAASRTNDDPEHAVRPFAGDRNGLVFAEGAAVLVLESLEAARARGAAIYGEIIGYGSTSDAFHITAPHPEGRGAILSMQHALRQAGLTPQDIDYINAHGTATDLNDAMETAAVKKVFGDHAYNVPMSSTKSMTGHGMGMTGALEAIFALLAIRDSVAPPTINLHVPDPACDLDYVANVARSMPIEIVMSNSFGFGGHNVSLILKKFVD